VSKRFDEATGEHVIQCDYCPATERTKAGPEVDLDNGDWHVVGNDTYCPTCWERIGEAE
jgi:hypothetical protein